LLSVLYPHYLRPFPSCSIAHFEPAGSSLSAAALLPRGTELQSRPIKGAVCKFRTAWDVRLPPLAIDGLVFDPGGGAGRGAPADRLPGSAEFLAGIAG
jgi:type VI secretion system protein ImpG